MSRRGTGSCALLAAAALTLASGCDWIDYAFMNSIPVDGAGGSMGQDVYVYLGVDGLSWTTLEDGFATGAFSDPRWRAAKLATIFPGTSDASWTRIMHTAKLEGYELEYYDPKSDALIHGGLLGGARHVLPSVSESLSLEAAYLGAFDFQANGYTHSIEAYSSVWTSAGETLDDLFFMLEGRMKTEQVFTAYLLEMDLLGHLGSREDCLALLHILDRRIDAFRKAHPEKRLHFTLVSDHGMDFAQIPRSRFIDMRDELPKVGVVPVEHLAGRDPRTEIYAVPVIHTRVTYVALHTHPDLTAEVASRASQLESVDFAVGSLTDGPAPAADPSRRFGIWTNGQLAVAFGYDETAHAYTIEGADPARFGLPEMRGPIADEDLFERTKRGPYPDLLYRVRTALEPVGVNHPAEVLLSFRQGWCSIGFRLPDGIDLFGPGYHGLARDIATLGVVLTDERDLPDVVRADSFLTLFPRARERIAARGLEVLEGDPDAARPLR